MLENCIPQIQFNLHEKGIILYLLSLVFKAVFNIEQAGYEDKELCSGQN